MFISPEHYTEAIKLLFLEKPPRKEVSTEFIRDTLAAYWDKPAGEISLVELRSVLRGLVGQGVVPRTMWRQKPGDTPEIRWVFVAPRPAPAPGKRKAKEEKPFTASAAGRRLNINKAS